MSMTNSTEYCVICGLSRKRHETVGTVGCDLHPFTFTVKRVNIQYQRGLSHGITFFDDQQADCFRVEWIDGRGEPFPGYDINFLCFPYGSMTGPHGDRTSKAQAYQQAQQDLDEIVDALPKPIDEWLN